MGMKFLRWNLNVLGRGFLEVEIGVQDLVETSVHPQKQSTWTDLISASETSC